MSPLVDWEIRLGRLNLCELQSELETYTTQWGNALDDEERWLEAAELQNKVGIITTAIAFYKQPSMDSALRAELGIATAPPYEPLTHRQEVLGTDYQKPSGSFLKKVQELGEAAAAIVGIVKS